MKYDGVKVFSTTKIRDRQNMGGTITDWIKRHPDYDIVHQETTQSSDAAFHCLSITLFYRLKRQD